MNEIITYIVLVFVVWRITHLITEEDGPFDLMIKLRKLAGSSFFGKLLSCFYCCSFWIGLIAASHTRDVLMTLILALYYSGAAILLERLTTKNE